MRDGNDIPRIRIRIEHSRTQRDGWGYSTTVEVTDERIELETVAQLLVEVRTLGERERDARNRRDAQRRDAIDQT